MPKAPSDSQSSSHHTFPRRQRQLGAISSGDGRNRKYDCVIELCHKARLRANTLTTTALSALRPIRAVPPPCRILAGGRTHRICTRLSALSAHAHTLSKSRFSSSTSVKDTHARVSSSNAELPMICRPPSQHSLTRLSPRRGTRRLTQPGAPHRGTKTAPPHTPRHTHMLPHASPRRRARRKSACPCPDAIKSRRGRAGRFRCASLYAIRRRGQSQVWIPSNPICISATAPASRRHRAGSVSALRRRGRLARPSVPRALISWR